MEKSPKSSHVVVETLIPESPSDNGNYLRLVCSVFFGISCWRGYFPKRERLQSVLGQKETPLVTRTGHFHLQRIFLALSVLGKRGGVLWCIQVVVHGRNINSGTKPGMGSQTLLWNLLPSYFKAIIFSCIKSLFLGNKSCDWDPTLQRIHQHLTTQPRGVSATPDLLTLLLLPKHKKHSNIILSH